MFHMPGVSPPIMSFRGVSGGFSWHQKNPISAPCPAVSDILMNSRRTVKILWWCHSCLSSQLFDMFSLHKLRMCQLQWVYVALGFSLSINPCTSPLADIFDAPSHLWRPQSMLSSLHFWSWDAIILASSCLAILSTFTKCMNSSLISYMVSTKLNIEATCFRLLTSVTSSANIELYFGWQTSSSKPLLILLLILILFHFLSLSYPLLIWLPMISINWLCIVLLV